VTFPLQSRTRLHRRWLLLACLLPLSCGVPPRGTIGAILLRRTSGRVFILDVPKHLAAYRAGIRPDDELLLVEGQDVRRLSDADLARILEGGVDEPVRLTLARGEKVLRLTVRRSMAEPYRIP
jgi:C-terminal processing protease CtpA/Prc